MFSKRSWRRQVTRCAMGISLILTTVVATASLLPTTKVTRDTFEVSLPNYIAKPLPVITVSEPSPMQVYRFVDDQDAHSVIFNIMVVPVTQKMGQDLDNATKKFAGGVLFGMAKKSGLKMDLGQAINSVKQSSIHNRTFHRAEFTAKSGTTEVFTTHTDHTLYAFILSSKDLIKLTEMQAALSSIHLKS